MDPVDSPGCVAMGDGHCSRRLPAGADVDSTRCCPLTVEQILAEIGGDFLKADRSTFAAAIDDGLERLARVLECSIATIWDDGPDGKVHRTYVWVDPEHGPMAGYPTEVISLDHPVSQAVRNSRGASVVSFAQHFSEDEPRRHDTIVAAPFLGVNDDDDEVVGAVTFAFPEFVESDAWWVEFLLASVAGFAALVGSLRRRVEAEAALVRRAEVNLALASITSGLVDASPDSETSVMENALALLGSALGADSLGVYLSTTVVETADLAWSWSAESGTNISDSIRPGIPVGDEMLVTSGRVECRIGPDGASGGVLIAKSWHPDEWDDQELGLIRSVAALVAQHRHRVGLERAVLVQQDQDSVLQEMATVLTGRSTPGVFTEALDRLAEQVGATQISLWRMFPTDSVSEGQPKDLVVRSRCRTCGFSEDGPFSDVLPAKVAAKTPPPGEVLDHSIDFVPNWLRSTAGHDLDPVPRRLTIASAPYAGAERIHLLVLSDDDGPIDEPRRRMFSRAATLLSGTLNRLAAQDTVSVAFESAPSAVTIRDRDRILISCNDAYLRFTGRSRDELIGRSVTEVLVEGDTADERPEDWKGPTVLPYRRPDGRVVWGRARSSDIRLPGRPDVLHLFHIEDITDARRNHLLLEHRASYDQLTDLPNRDHFIASVDRAHCEDGCVVMVVDIDNFRAINDTFGHHTGDGALVACAERLRAEIGPADQICRLGGDEFAVHLHGPLGESDAAAAASRILAAVHEPIRVNGREVILTISAGVAMADRCDDVEELLRHADAAMDKAKRIGRDRWVMFDDALRHEVTSKLRLEAELRVALGNGEFEVHYQPEVRLSSGHIIGTEALVRWHHPERGLLSAGAFIEVAEESGMIVELGRWVLQEATRQAVEWHRLGHHLTMRVNLSVRQLRPEVADEIRDALRSSGLRPDRLCLEVTETSIMGDIPEAMGLLTAISQLGVKLAIDDFGTGYSSLAYLKRFPVDILKIDKSFVDGVGIDDEDTGIVETIVNLARVLGLDVVAEGIENPRQITDLLNLGCDRAQGFYLARPAPAADIERLLGA